MRNKASGKWRNLIIYRSCLLLLRESKWREMMSWTDSSDGGTRNAYRISLGISLRKSHLVDQKEDGKTILN
jgi:hypothetical protein